MGDIAVDIFLETLKGLITSSNLDFVIDNKDQLQSLEKEIKYLRGFLKITEKKRNEDSEVMKLVIQIRGLVSEAENIIDLFVVLAYKACLGEHQGHLSLDLESVQNKIKTLTDDVKQIYGKNMDDLNGVEVKKLKHSSTKCEGGSSSSGGRNTSKVVETKAVVGFEDEVKKLMGKLHNSGECGRLEIISIVGAGGGGKTTLAREAYDHPLTSQKFEICAWVNVSQDYNITTKSSDMLISIMESASLEKLEDYMNLDKDKLGEKVYKCLQGRKYLIVMDDIWGIEAWNDIQRSFPRKECKDSKVLLTSRLPIQPDSIHCVHHCLKPLQESCSWELLQKKVFGMKQCPQELEAIGKQIAEKCKGLPLAIVAIAGILATEEKTLNVWEEVANHLSSTIAKNQKDCMEILELSYNHLPLHLKACFLYIGAHPEDYEIPLRELIWLWIAEGFIQHSDEGKSLEAIAKDYLTGLIDRNLVMVARKSKCHGGIKTCNIHDLLRELCLKKAKEDNFFVRFYEGDSFSPTNEHLRLFIGPKFFRRFPSRSCAGNLRSFLCLPLENCPCYKPLSFFAENFQLLRVLNFMSGDLKEIRTGDLVHLRYLSIMYCDLRGGFRMPVFFYYLPNLETLSIDLGCGDWISLPRDIVKMVKLRHLYTKWGIFEYHYDSYDIEIDGYLLDGLQTLHHMCICEHCLHFLKRTPNLRKLGLTGHRARKRDDVLMLLDLHFLKCLEKLYVRGWELGASVPLASTGLIMLPHTLKKLTLQFTYLDWEKLSIILQTLPILEVLKLLKHACVGPVWNTSELEEGFSQLKYLSLQELDIREWNASAEQFPRLEVLVLGECTNLEKIPIDFANLYDLCEIKLERCRRSADESAREIQEGQRYTKGDDDCLNLLIT